MHQVRPDSTSEIDFKDFQDSLREKETGKLPFSKKRRVSLILKNGEFVDAEPDYSKKGGKKIRKLSKSRKRKTKKSLGGTGLKGKLGDQKRVSITREKRRAVILESDADFGGFLWENVATENAHIRRSKEASKIRGDKSKQSLKKTRSQPTIGNFNIKNQALIDGFRVNKSVMERDSQLTVSFSDEDDITLLSSIDDSPVISKKSKRKSLVRRNAIRDLQFPGVTEGCTPPEIGRICIKRTKSFVTFPSKLED